MFFYQKDPLSQLVDFQLSSDFVEGCIFKHNFFLIMLFMSIHTEENGENNLKKNSTHKIQRVALKSKPSGKNKK